MTERSSKGLTGATFVAGVASAALLAVIGCVKPLADVHDELERRRSGPLPSVDSNAPPLRYSSPESVLRAPQTDRPASGQ